MTTGEDHNPYQPPTVEAQVGFTEAGAGPGDGPQLAGRWARLGAALIDSMIMLVILVPVQWKAGVYDDMEAYASNYLGNVAWGLGGFLLTLVVNGYLLHTRAQTVGKAALGIKIVTLDGQNADLARVALRRILPMTLLGVIPAAGGFLAGIDPLFIFREDKRCLHDLIAGTRVVRA